jgi:tetratricopeptide (TPR) repeat protein
MGNIYYEFEEHPKAIEYYKRYLAQKPDDVGVRTDLGTMYLYSNNFDQAVAEYQTVIAKDPGFFQAYFNLGVAYNEKGEKGKSLEALNKAKSLTTDQTVRDRIDQFLAQISAPVSPSVAEAPPATTPSAQVAQVQIDPALSPFQQAVERVLRGANIMASGSIASSGRLPPRREYCCRISRCQACPRKCAPDSSVDCKPKSSKPKKPPGLAALPGSS